MARKTKSMRQLQLLLLMAAIALSQWNQNPSSFEWEQIRFHKIELYEQWIKWRRIWIQFQLGQRDRGMHAKLHGQKKKNNSKTNEINIKISQAIQQQNNNNIHDKSSFFGKMWMWTIRLRILYFAFVIVCCWNCLKYVSNVMGAAFH